jgi:AcrR family transcriptional regulator
MALTKKERTQKELLQAAKAIIKEKGYEAVTVRYLAEITGYAYTNLYYYFKDLNALFWSLRLEMIEDMIAELSAVPIQKDDAVEEILSAFNTYTDYFFKHPNVFRFFYFYPFIQPEGDERYQTLELRFDTQWQTSFSRLIHEGTLPPEDLQTVAKTIIFAIQGMIMLSFSSNGTMKKENIKEELTNLVHYLIPKRNLRT